jgi:hypothetical protein
MEIGFHAVFGYYRELQTLLARAGRSITDPRYFTGNDGVHLMYEGGARAVNRLDIPSGPLDVGAFFNNGFVGYQGMSFREKVAAAGWMASTGVRLLTQTVDPALDEHAFTAHCVSTGLDIELTHKSWFRYVLDLAFNFPAPGSAYVGMYGFQRLMGPENSTVYYLNGPLSEIIVRPLADLFLSLGGRIELCTKATRVELNHGGRRIEKIFTQPMATADPIPGVSDHVRVSPIGGGYTLEENPYPVGDPAPPAGVPSRELRHGADFDEVLWTLPVDSTRALLRTTPEFERAVLEVPELRAVWALRSVASTSLRFWTPEKVMPSDFTTVVMGTPQPAATIIDYANRVDELRRSQWGSVVELEGQEGLHGELTDTELVRESLERFAELPFVNRQNLQIDKILSQTDGHHFEFRRNTAHHMRYLLMEPGHWKYRMRQEAGHYANLTFAGDWMSGTQPTASMEAAVRTGRVAANALRERHGLALVD